MFNSVTYNSLEFNMAGVSTVVIVGAPIFLDQDDEIIVLDVNDASITLSDDDEAVVLDVDTATLTLGSDEGTGLLL